MKFIKNMREYFNRRKTMELQVTRFSSGSDSTLGILSEVSDDNQFLAFTLEDEYREVKVKGKTRIPSGRYKIELRKEGGFHNKYKDRFADIHKGMLHVTNVPNFKYILLHIGNSDLDSSGCTLLGDSITQNISKKGFLSNSTDAYKRVYPRIANALENGEEVWITYKDVG